ncbi:tRNA-specific adenosine deaminase 2 [Oratosquilla oratoria]|uniref:tRNA-specific adenosine deaminase 2 n=1 Tax=Oratosquilla oratoria TaxID=337810 RepID=UPI003F758711
MTDQKGNTSKWMDEAFTMAQEALQVGEVPVGCTFVYKDEIVGKGRNSVNKTKNATRHAEMNCVDEVLVYCKQRNLDFRDVFPQITVYVTVEPCGMCAAALGQLQIKNIVFGCCNDRFGGCGSVIDVPKLCEYDFNITKGLHAEKAIELLKDFYKGENPNVPSAKVKKKRSLQ